MSKKKFIFRFYQNEHFCYLTGADGHSLYVRWPKSTVSVEQAQKEADQHIGQIIRNQSPDRIKYIVVPYEQKEGTNEKTVPLLDALKQSKPEDFDKASKSLLN